MMGGFVARTNRERERFDLLLASGYSREEAARYLALEAGWVAALSNIRPERLTRLAAAATVDDQWRRIRQH